jgi:hypothetical protein
MCLKTRTFVGRLVRDREVRPFQNPLEAENVICKTRRYTDRSYPWAISLHNKRLLEDAANLVDRGIETH